MAVTIQQIAKEAGVSKATVSRVLNGLGVKYETEQKVKAVMLKRDYRPNRFARGLSAQRTGFLGVITPTFADPYVAAVLSGVEEESNRQGKLITLSVFHPLQANEKESVHNLVNPPLVEGLLFLVPTPAMDSVLRDLVRQKFPLVVVSERRYEDLAHSVVIDNFNGAYQATQYLISKGHRRVGFVQGNPELTDSKDRFEGYQQALKEAGIPLEKDLLLPGNYELTAGQEACEKFLQMAHPPDAVFASNDRMAIGVLKTLQSRGKQGAFAVMGFDDIPMAALMNPSLTTMGYDLNELGKLAVHKLLRLISGEEKTRSTLQLKGHLVVRESA